MKNWQEKKEVELSRLYRKGIKHNKRQITQPLPSPVQGMNYHPNPRQADGRFAHTHRHHPIHWEGPETPKELGLK